MRDCAKSSSMVVGTRKVGRCRSPVSAARLLDDDRGGVGERAGARTQDPVIKSHVLYRLSYALAPKGYDDEAVEPDSRTR
jgi:hypothetical protein